MKTLISALFLGLLPMFAIAAPDEAADAFLSKKNPTLTKQERKALAIGADAPAAAPAPGPDGTVRFVFGAARPSIVCAPLQVCDVELQPGEQVTSIELGDATRWLVTPAVTGSGATEVQHLIIKALDAGLETSLIVPTNRRTYRLRLRSHRTEYMTAVSFTYPEVVQAKWDAARAVEVREREQRTIPATGEYLGDLSFNYSMDGNASWKPIRVYNDGVKTIIQMPRSMAQTEAPTLLVVRKEAAGFSDEEVAVVNYRLQGDRFIVDAIFDKAILIAGVGSSQDRVTITRGK